MNATAEGRVLGLQADVLALCATTGELVADPLAVQDRSIVVPIGNSALLVGGAVVAIAASRAAGVAIAHFTRDADLLRIVLAKDASAAATIVAPLAGSAAILAGGVLRQPAGTPIRIHALAVARADLACGTVLACLA
jgi:hypothetical protein